MKLSELVDQGRNRLDPNTYLSALINDGRVETARSFLNKQHDRQPTVPLQNFN